MPPGTYATAVLVYYAACTSNYTYYVDPPDTSIFEPESWQDKSLRYLWKPVEVIRRLWIVIQRRSDPRWSRKRWRAKT